MSKFQPEVVVIILNYNGISDTTICLKSLLRTRYTNFKIIVADNGSKFDEVGLLKTSFKNKKIEFISFNTNLGFSEGNNRIIERTKSKYVVLLNNDTRVKPGWLGEMAKLMESDKKIAACQAKILSMSYPLYFDYAGAAGGFLDKLGYPYARGRIGFHLEKDLGQYDDVVDLFWGSGTCLMLRRRLALEAGLLPANFFFYHEETDLCWRLKNLKYRIVFCPKAVIFHKGAGSSRRYLLKRTFYIHRNNLLMISRNLSFRKLWWVLPIRLVLDYASMFFYLRYGRWQFIGSVLFAQVSFLIQAPGIFFKRLLSRQPASNCTDDSLYPFSILWNYFFLKRRTYSRILDSKQPVSNTIKYEEVFS